MSNLASSAENRKENFTPPSDPSKTPVRQRSQHRDQAIAWAKAVNIPTHYPDGRKVPGHANLRPLLVHLASWCDDDFEAPAAIRDFRDSAGRRRQGILSRLGMNINIYRKAASALGRLGLIETAVHGGNQYRTTWARYRLKVTTIQTSFQERLPEDEIRTEDANLTIMTHAQDELTHAPGHVSGMCQACVRHVSGMCQACVTPITNGIKGDSGLGREGLPPRSPTAGTQEDGLSLFRKNLEHGLSEFGLEIDMRRVKIDPRDFANFIERRGRPPGVQETYYVMALCDRQRPGQIEPYVQRVLEKLLRDARERHPEIAFDIHK